MAPNTSARRRSTHRPGAEQHRTRRVAHRCSSPPQMRATTRLRAMSEQDKVPTSVSSSRGARKNQQRQRAYHYKPRPVVACQLLVWMTCPEPQPRRTLRLDWCAQVRPLLPSGCLMPSGMAHLLALPSSRPRSTRPGSALATSRSPPLRSCSRGREGSEEVGSKTHPR